MTKLNLQKVLVLALSTAVFGLTGCGGGSSSDSGSATTGTNQISDADRYFYSGKPGDVFQYSQTMTMKISGRPDTTINSMDKQTYSQVQAIPTKYGYKGSLLPYLYSENTTDGILDSKTYMTIDGDDIIDDGLDTFTNIDYVTESGDDPEPNSLILGKTYSGKIESVLFSSSTGARVGTETMDLSITCDNKTTLTITSGTFETLSCLVSSTISTIESGQSFIGTMTGKTWIGKDIGEVKSDYSMTGSVGGTSFTASYLRSLTTSNKSTSRFATTYESGTKEDEMSRLVKSSLNRLHTAPFSQFGKLR